MIDPQTPLKYQIQEPKINAEDKSPAIFLIHGYGSHMDDLFAFAPYLSDKHTIIALEAPFSMGPDSYAWYAFEYDEYGGLQANNVQAMEVIACLIVNIKNLCRDHALEENDLTLLGFSQGAILSWAIALQQPNFIRRVVALSGYINSDFVENIQPEFLVYAAHGINDLVIPIEKARSSIAVLFEKYPNIHYQEYEDGHSVSQENFTHLLDWLGATDL